MAKMSLMKKLGIAGGSMFVLSMLMWFGFPKLLVSMIKSQVNLKPGTDVRALWSKIPFAIDFRVYLYNVTNPDEVKAGAKPIVRQVGPYYFEEWHEKDNLIDRDEDDSVEYAIKNTFHFKAEKSEGLTGEEELTLPHVFILAMVMTVLRDKPTAMPVINKAVNSIFKNPENVFVKVKAMDLMFRGLMVDCTVSDFAGGAVCGMLKENPEGLIVYDEEHFGFALLGAKNGTAAKQRMRVLRGRKNLMDIGRVIEFDGKKNISKWDDDRCDAFNGTDSYVFHPFLYENEDVVSFAPDLCRSLGAYFQKKTKLAGLNTNRYTAYLGDPSSDESLKCNCEAADKCLKAGMMDLHKCLGVPLVASHPHFYMADESYLATVDGLSPKQEDHEIFLDFEPFTGTPMFAKKRLQFNIPITKVDKFKIMKNFPDAMLPLFWVEEGVLLPDELIAQVKMIHTMLTVVAVMKWLMLLAGLGMGGGAGFLYYKATQGSDKLEITKVPKDNGKPGSTEKKISPLNVNTLQARVPPVLD
ncbi:sensory neuron membrane protein 1-like [Phymastichus coffea]|uniref:sensory neuron membrane protein 1-like n=1 Tax=Phymastichus coffea TaxID=108790 RepID=UPI00273C2C94|nr:sensory neuron membrane protein 1-like [Phymastichus coffea]